MHIGISNHLLVQKTKTCISKHLFPRDFKSQFLLAISTNSFICFKIKTSHRELLAADNRSCRQWQDKQSIKNNTWAVLCIFWSFNIVTYVYIVYSQLLSCTISCKNMSFFKKIFFATERSLISILMNSQAIKGSGS